MNMLANVLSWADATAYDGLLYGIVILSFVLTFKYIRFPDVTTAGSFVLGGAIAAVVQVRLGSDPITAILCATAAGAGAGVITSVFALGLRIESLLAGVLSAFLLYGINLLMLRPTLAYGSLATVLTPFADYDRTLAFSGLAWHPAEIVFVLVLVLLIKLVLDFVLGSEFGLHLRALEDEKSGDAAIARFGGNPNAYRAFALIAGNALVALSGALVSMREGAATLDRGFDILITAIIAFLVGQQLRGAIQRFREAIAHTVSPNRALHEYRFTATTAAILGSVTYFGLVALAYRTNTPPELVRIAIAVYVAVAVGDLSVFRRKAALRKARRAEHTSERRESRKRPSTAKVLDVQQLKYRYPTSDKDVLQGVDLIVGRSEIIRITGPNGSGKSTLLRLIGGLIDSPTAGSIWMNGVNLTSSPRRRLATCVYLSQDARTTIVTTFTVEENLAMARAGGRTSIFKRALSKNRMAQFAPKLAKIGLSVDLINKRADALSGGEAQLLNLLSVFARETLPQLLLLDEPFNNLDLTNVERAKGLIDQANSDGIAVLIVNHAVPIDFDYSNTISLQPAGQA